MTNKNYQSCGMSMKETTDFEGKNPENKYCRFCIDED